MAVGLLAREDRTPFPFCHSFHHDHYDQPNHYHVALAVLAVLIAALAMKVDARQKVEVEDAKGKRDVVDFFHFDIDDSFPLY